MLNNGKRIKGLIVDNDDSMRFLIKEFLEEELNADIEVFSDSHALLDRLKIASLKNQHIDFITTDIWRPGKNGVDMVREIRALTDDMLYHNGLRLRYIPIFVISAVLNNYISKLLEISSDLILVEKPFAFTELCQKIVEGLGKYRKCIISDFLFLGYSIQFMNGQYWVGEQFSMDSFHETKYFKGLNKSASNAVTRKILIQNSTSFANNSIYLFESLLNDPKKNEHDFHEFFLHFPEFLLGNNYDVLYSENRLKSEIQNYRMDILAQPRGFRSEENMWALIELKKHTEKILTDKKYHANFSKSVYNGITQLRNYQNYFNDPRNFDDIKKKYNGVVPNPKLSLIIGRTPSGNVDLYNKMRRQNLDVNIYSYDEILAFRKVQVKHYESLGL